MFIDWLHRIRLSADTCTTCQLLKICYISQYAYRTHAHERWYIIHSFASAFGQWPLYNSIVEDCSGLCWVLMYVPNHHRFQTKRVLYLNIICWIYIFCNSFWVCFVLFFYLAFIVGTEFSLYKYYVYIIVLFLCVNVCIWKSVHKNLKKYINVSDTRIIY